MASDRGEISRGETFQPDSAEQLAELVAWAAGEEAPLEILGAGSKQGLGRPLQVSHGVSLAALTGVTLYEPEELVLSAGAGTPMAEIQTLLDENKQHLAFEPADFGPLFGKAAGGGTLGGMIGCNLAGPRRIKAGAARDHFLGLQAVSGRGEQFKSGGRVVKNVTGYDLCKLLTGSYGTLAALTEVTVKVLPAPEKTRTVLLYGLEDATAAKAMTRALVSAHEVSGAAHLPAAVAATSSVSYVTDSGGAVTALRVEGPGPSVEYRCAALRRELGDLAETEELHGHNSGTFWREIAGVAVFAGRPELAVWRISVAPSAGPAVLAQLADVVGSLHYYDWGGGLIWLAVPAEGGAAEALVRQAVDLHGGHATLFRAPESVRAAVPVFQPLDPAQASLSQRVKEGFDPRRILNPGRMYPGL